MNPPEDFYVIRAMRKYGGSFVQALGEAAAQADDKNLWRIKVTWPEYWDKYAAIAVNEAAKEAKV